MTRLSSLFHPALEKLAQWVGLRTIAFEVTQACNQDCVFCYNVWKDRDYPRGEADTPQAVIGGISIRL